MHLRVPRSRAVLAELGRPVAGRSIVLAQLWALLWLLPLQAPAAPPRAPRKPATTNYHGVTVTDNYPWLENGDNPAVQKWVQAQNNAARSYLEKLPARAALEYQLGQLFTNAPAEYSAVQVRAGKLFALKRTPPALEAVLVVLTSPTNAASAKVLLGPGLNIDFYEPSRDGRFVAVSLREPASDAGTLHVFESGSGRELPDVVTRAAFPTAGGSVAWGADSAGFYYTRYPHPGERPDAELPFHQQVYFHKLGTAENEDRYEVGREFPRIGRITLKTSGDGLRRQRPRR